MTRAMKDSGVEWIGEIPADWTCGKCKSILIANDGGVWGNDPQGNESDIIVIRSTEQTIDGKWLIENPAKRDLSGVDYKKAIIEKDDLLITKSSGSDLHIGKTTIADAYFVKHECCFSNFIQRIRCTGFFPQLLWYLFNSSIIREQCVYLQNSTSGIGNINSEIINNLYIPIPPIIEQRHIADFLDRRCAEIDRVIDATQQTIAEYKALKQSIITEAVTKGVRGPRPMKDSGVEWIGEIPAEWEIISIGRLFCFVGGYAFSSDAFCEQTNHQVVRMGNIKDDCLVLTEKAVFIDDNYAEMAQSFIIKAEDILFTMTGTKGKKDYFYTLLIGQKDIQSVNLYLNQRVGCFRKNKECSMQYYNYLLKVPELKEYVFLFETGTANQGNLGIATIRKTRLTFPSLEEQNEIADYLNNRCREIDQLIRQKQQLLTELKNYNKSVIYEYVTGKKEVG